MAGYTKNVAILRGLKEGFSADGGQLSGIVKCEKYGSEFKFEATLINFAPLSDGRYVCAVSDGARVKVIDGTYFEGEDEIDPSDGFAALVAYVKDGVFPIASAICGEYAAAAIELKGAVEKYERAQPQKGRGAYEDDALAEENYYEYEQADEDGGAVCEDKEKEEDGCKACEDEEDSRPFAPPLSRGECFYERMKGEIEGIFAARPREVGLEEAVENSRWAKICYGDDKFYVFGVISDGEKPQYICYGVPADGDAPPDSLKGLASLIPTADGGFWVMYQDALTGASLKITVE